MCTYANVQAKKYFDTGFGFLWHHLLRRTPFIVQNF